MSDPKGKRLEWFDEESGKPVIEAHARKLEGFLAAIADGIIEEHELQAQEERLTQLMKRVQPKLDDALHAEVTQLLCELTAYDIMQFATIMQSSRPKTVFRG